MKSRTLKALYITSAFSLLFVLLLAFFYPGQDLLYQRSFPKNSNGLSLPVTSSWNLVPIPSGSEGRALTITLSSPFEGMSGQINSIHYGSSNHLMLYLIRSLPIPIS